MAYLRKLGDDATDAVNSLLTSAGGAQIFAVSTPWFLAGLVVFALAALGAGGKKARRSVRKYVRKRRARKEEAKALKTRLRELEGGWTGG
jgi:hypothetical protein